MAEEKKRIEFIDLAKGVCIILVVLHHCHIETPYLGYIRMPLYFILSGLFFKKYDGFWNFTKRKINKILIPFLFFYSVSFCIYLAINHFVPDIKVNSEVEQFYFSDPLYSRLCFNNPLWFLLSLLWCNLLYYLVQIFSKKMLFQGLIAIVFATIYWATRDKLLMPFYFDNTLRFFPYFFLGSILRKTSLLYESEVISYPQKYRDVNSPDIMIGAICISSFFMIVNIPITISAISLVRNYFASTLGVLAMLLLLKKIKKLPVISYYGRYSIVILCTSYLVYSPLRVIIPKFLYLPVQTVLVYDFIAFLITMFVEYFVIWFCIKYMPYVTAQKDVISVGK